MWTTVGQFIGVLLFEVGAVGPVVFICGACALAAVAVVPVAWRWAQS